MAERQRRTIPDDAMDPLAAILPEAGNTSQESGRASRASASSRGEQDTEAPSATPAQRKMAVKPITVKKEQLAIRVSEDLAEEIRDCVVFLAGPPLHLTLSKLGEMALREKIEQLKMEHNHGELFPKREESLKTGRPIR